MILQSLVSYYDRLAGDPEQEIAQPGFSRQKISFEIVLKPDGSLSAIQDAREERDGKQRPRMLTVPGQAKPPGSGLNPCFLWDNATYMLGFKPDDPKPERTGNAFEAFLDRHLELEKEIGDKAYSAVCAFLRRWKPEQANKHKDLAEIATSFGVFRVQGAREYVHDRPKVLEYWRTQLGSTSAERVAPSLISGDTQPIARLHEPKIKGVLGAQSSGAAIVSFNLDAFESYEKSQSYNAPVGVDDAFRYCTALDRLTSDHRRRVQIGDATVVFWAEKPLAEFENAFGPVIGADLAAEDASTVKQVDAFWRHCKDAAAGKPINNGDIPFYVLGLSPNASRLSVRFWLTGTVQQFAERLGRHMADLEMGYAPPDAPIATLRRLLDETARERKDIKPLLGGAVMRAVLSDIPYPQALFSAVLSRIRADRRLNHTRAAILKAVLARKERLDDANNAQKKEIPVSLNRDHPESAYQLGRLFAVLEKTQEEAFDNKLNATIKDRFFSAASATPVAAFPRLLRLHSHHLNKLENRGRRTNLEKLVQEVCQKIDDFPGQLPLDDQGLFFIGYYHQRQDLFTKKSDSDESTDNKEQN